MKNANAFGRDDIALPLDGPAIDKSATCTVGHDETTPDRAGPLKAIRRHCVDCCNGSFTEVSACVSTRCAFWTMRDGHRPDAETVAAVALLNTHPSEVVKTQAEVAAGSRVKVAIRRRCLDCAGGSHVAVKACTVTACDLHPYRLGKTGRVSPMTDAQRKAARERFAKVRVQRTVNGCANSSR